MSGDLAILRAQLEEQTSLATTLTRENERLSGRLHDHDRVDLDTDA